MQNTRPNRRQIKKDFIIFHIAVKKRRLFLFSKLYGIINPVQNLALMERSGIRDCSELFKKLKAFNSKKVPNS